MIDKEIILAALEKHWNLKPAAEELGIGYSTLRKYIKEHGIVHHSRCKKDGPTFDRKKYNVAKVTKVRRQRKIECLNYLGGMKCTMCGYNKPIPAAYAFHHRDPKEKDPNFGKMKTNNWPMSYILAEMDKCIVVCHNCHAEIHWEMDK